MASEENDSIYIQKKGNEIVKAFNAEKWLKSWQCGEEEKLASLADRVVEGGGGGCQPSEPLPPKRQAVVERLRRRIEGYRRHQNNCIPRFEHSFNGVVDQNLQDTLLLKQRFLENKPKRPVKKSEKKPADGAINSLSLPKFPKCSAPEETGDGFGNSAEVQKQQSQKQHENMTKFSVEIVQQLEFTSSSTNSQISTNVTVKALNTSVKGDMSPSPQSPQRNLNMVECKQEPENIDFVDLEECAAALEKDAAANGGNSFLPGLTDLIGGDAAGSISSDAFKDLISEISEYNPEFMKDFDFDGGGCKGRDQTKLEDNIKPPPVSCATIQSGMLTQQIQPPQGLTLSKPELSPAAQTLKNMAEQHQNKSQIGISFNPRIGQKPYSYPQSDMTSYKVPAPNLYLSDNIKQEVFSNQGSPVSYSPIIKAPSPQRLPTPQNHGLQQVFKQQMQYQGFNAIPQYRQQNLVKMDYSKSGPTLPQQVLSFQPQPMSVGAPILRAPQPHYLPRGYLPPQRSYSVAKAPRHIQPQENWILHQSPQQVQVLPQSPQLVQTQIGGRVHQSIQSGFTRQVSSSIATSLPYSYVNTFPAFGVHQPVGFSQNTATLAPEFNLDFLEQLPNTGETGTLSDQELFSSLDSGTTFNFQDIL